jgi:hypothetical protein
MKKVIRLTESDLEKIIRKVIQEQSTGVAFGTKVNGFKMKRETKEQMDAPVSTKSLKNLDDSTLMVFVDPFRGMDSLVRAMAYLKGKGLQPGKRTFEVDPLTAKSFPRPDSPQDIASDKVIDMVRSGLRTVAKNNYVDERWFTKGFPIINEDGRDITTEVLEFYPNFYNVLWKITQDQMKKV